jgi:hypothetical protein
VTTSVIPLTKHQSGSVYPSFSSIESNIIWDELIPNIMDDPVSSLIDAQPNTEKQGGESQSPLAEPIVSLTSSCALSVVRFGSPLSSSLPQWRSPPTQVTSSWSWAPLHHSLRPPPHRSTADDNPSPYDTEASCGCWSYGGPSTRSGHPGRGHRGEGGGWSKRPRPPGDPELLMLKVVYAWCPTAS